MIIFDFYFPDKEIIASMEKKTKKQKKKRS